MLLATPPTSQSHPTGTKAKSVTWIHIRLREVPVQPRLQCVSQMDDHVGPSDDEGDMPVCSGRGTVADVVVAGASMPHRGSLMDSNPTMLEVASAT